jgi:hypothetical protein
LPYAYTQVYRNGVIEAVSAGILNGYEGNLILSVLYEETLLTYLPRCFEILRHLGCLPPVVLGIALIGVRGMRMATNVILQLQTGGGTAINRDVLMLPEFIVEDFSEDPAKLLRGSFDMAWNACGYPSSRNFDATGKWKPQN